MRPGEDLRGRFGNARLSYANLPSFGLSGSFVNANFFHANLVGASFGFSDLRGTNFNRADLRDAKLFWSNLRGADFRRSNLIGANLLNSEHDATTQVQDARIDQSTLGEWW